MTVVEDILSRLAALGCQVELGNGDGLAIVGAIERLPVELTAAARRAKLALVVELIRQKVLSLKDTIDGDAPFADRLAKVREYQEIMDRLSKAQERLFASWRELGFTVVWSALVEEFLIVGDGAPPPGAEGHVMYSWAEVEALKGANPEQVREAHRVKKAFAGKVRLGV